jgi:hypothetical protein
LAVTGAILLKSPLKELGTGRSKLEREFRGMSVEVLKDSSMSSMRGVAGEFPKLDTEWRAEWLKLGMSSSVRAFLSRTPCFNAKCAAIVGSRFGG